MAPGSTHQDPRLRRPNKSVENDLEGSRKRVASSSPTTDPPSHKLQKNLSFHETHRHLSEQPREPTAARFTNATFADSRRSSLQSFPNGPPEDSPPTMDSTTGASVRPLADGSEGSHTAPNTAVISADSNDSLAAILMRFAEQSAYLAESRITFAHARIAHEAAKKKNDNTRKHFAQFPAVKEHMTQEYESTYRKMNEEQQKFREQQQTLGQTATALADVQPRNSGSDHVSRADFDHLEARFDALSKSHSSALARLKFAESTAQNVLDQSIKIQNQVDHRSGSWQKIAEVEQTVKTVEQETRDALTQAVKDLENGHAGMLIEVQKKYEDQLHSYLELVKKEYQDGLNYAVERARKEQTEALERAVHNICERHDQEIRVLREETAHSKPSVNDSPLGLVAFRPVMPSADEENIDLPFKARVWNELESIKSGLAALDDQYNNITTEDVVKSMVDQVMVMYPDIKDTQNLVLRSNANLIQIQDALKETSIRLDKLDKDYRNEVTLLKDVVNRHETLVSNGGQHLKTVGEEVKELQRNIMRLEGVLKRSMEQARLS